METGRITRARSSGLSKSGRNDRKIAGGRSGHGFKHGPVVGEYVARRVAGESPEPELEALFHVK